MWQNWLECRQCPVEQHRSRERSAGSIVGRGGSPAWHYLQIDRRHTDLLCRCGSFQHCLCCTALDDGWVEIFNILKIIFRSLPGAREDYRSLSRYLTSPRLSCPVASVIQHARTSTQDGTPAPLPLQLCRASPSARE